MEEQQVNPTEDQTSTGFTFVDESEVVESLNRSSLSQRFRKRFKNSLRRKRLSKSSPNK